MAPNPCLPLRAEATGITALGQSGALHSSSGAGEPWGDGDTGEGQLQGRWRRWVVLGAAQEGRPLIRGLCAMAGGLTACHLRVSWSSEGGLGHRALLQTMLQYPHLLPRGEQAKAIPRHCHCQPTVLLPTARHFSDHLPAGKGPDRGLSASTAFPSLAYN